MSWGDSDIFFSTCTLEKITRPFQLLYLTKNNLQKDISTQVPSLELSPHVSTRILKLKRFLVQSFSRSLMLKNWEFGYDFFFSNIQSKIWVFFCKYLSTYVHQGVSKVWYQGILKATVSGVFEDLKFKISEGSEQN